MSALFAIRLKTRQEFQLLPEINPREGDFFSELEEYYLELRDVLLPNTFQASMDGVPMEELRNPNESTARWKLSGGFYAGILRITIRQKDRIFIDTEIIFSPNAAKLTRQNFDLMVKEILETTFSLLSISQFRFPVGKGSGDIPPPIARLEYLRSRFRRISDSVRAINHTQLRILKGIHQKIDLRKVKKVSAGELAQSFRSGEMFGHNNWEISSNLGTAYLPRTLTRWRNVVSSDIREHRAIKAVLKSWRGWLIGAALLLDNRSDQDSSIIPISKLWALRCRQMAKEIDELLDLPVFEAVADAPERVTMSPIFRWIPAYRDFFNLHRDFQLGISRVHGDFLQVPLSRTFELYELWVFLKLAKAAISLFRLESVDLSSFFDGRPTSSGLKLKQGALELSINPGVTLLFKKSYKEYWLSRSDCFVGSFSRTMIPDVSISRTTTSVDELTEVKLLVVDAKYRIDSQLNDAISSLHTYRDAIVQSDEDGSGVAKRTVVGSYLATPHVASEEDVGNATSWMESGMPGRLFHPEFRGKFKFGAFTIKPGISDADAEMVMRSICGDAGIPIPTLDED